MKKVALVSLFVLALSVISFAQQKPVAPLPQTPAAAEVKLTVEEEKSLELAFMKLKEAGAAASPDAIGKAIAEYITAVQENVQAANAALQAEAQKIAKDKDGYEVRQDPQTGKFSLVKKAGIVPKPIW